MASALSVALTGVLLSTNSVGAATSHRFTLPSGVEVSIVEAPFRKAEFRIQGCAREGDACRINGRVPFGRTSALPKSYVTKFSISFGGSTYSLDSSDMYDAWGDRPMEYPGKVRYLGGRCFDARNCQIRGLFSDGAGSFVAEWKVVNGSPMRTVLTDSSDVVDLFMTHIDPPVFE